MKQRIEIVQLFKKIYFHFERMIKERFSGLGVTLSKDFPKGQDSSYLCFGTTEFQPTNRICKACPHFLECGEVFPKKER